MNALNNLWPSILASIVISAIVTSIAQYIIARYNKTVEYKNEYYKSVLERRINAYGFVEELIMNLKVTVAEGSGPYHLIFSDDKEHFRKCHQALTTARIAGIWLSPKLSDLLSEYNKLYFNMLSEVESSNEIKNIGRKYYELIAGLRVKLEKQLLHDLLDMHEVPKFLKTKQNEQQGYTQYKIQKK